MFVGRRPQLAALDAVLARAGNGDGSAVLVEGEAGIGKSRLMARLESRAGAADVTVLVGAAYALNELGLVQQLTGDYPAAAASHQQALELCRDAASATGSARPKR